MRKKRTLKSYTADYIKAVTQDDEKKPTKAELKAYKEDAKFTYEHNKEQQGNGVWY